MVVLPRDSPGSGGKDPRDEAGCWLFARDARFGGAASKGGWRPLRTAPRTPCEGLVAHALHNLSSHRPHTRRRTHTPFIHGKTASYSIAFHSTPNHHHHHHQPTCFNQQMHTAPRSDPPKLNQPLLMQLLLPLPILLELLRLALGHLTPISQLSRQALSVPLNILGVALEQLLRRHRGLGPFFLVGFFPRLTCYLDVSKL